MIETKLITTVVKLEERNVYTYEWRDDAWYLIDSKRNEKKPAHHEILPDDDVCQTKLYTA